MSIFNTILKSYGSVYMEYFRVIRQIVSRIIFQKIKGISWI